MYEIIEKNQYGVLVRKIKSIPTECEKCKYTGLSVTLQPCKSCKVDNSYYLPDSEAEKLESEISDTQKELIGLRVEFLVEKEKSKALEEYSRGLELKVNELEICEHPYKSLERNENGLFCNKCKKQISHDPNIY